MSRLPLLHGIALIALLTGCSNPPPPDLGNISWEQDNLWEGDNLPGAGEGFVATPPEGGDPAAQQPEFEGDAGPFQGDASQGGSGQGDGFDGDFKPGEEPAGEQNQDATADEPAPEFEPPDANADAPHAGQARDAASHVSDASSGTVPVVGMSEASSLGCENQVDDDNDGLVDCEDDECSDHPACGGTAAAPLAGENVGYGCSNGEDDDNDGAIDCDDSDCIQGGRCQQVEPAAPEAGEDVGAGCFNREDDDGDGLVDCADDDCRNNEQCR